MNREFGLKELNDITLKATYPIVVGNRTYEPGEVIVRFDNIQLANFKEITERVSARGGYGNSTRVTWDDPKEIQLNFTQGTISQKQFSLLSNSKIVAQKENEKIKIPGHFIGESDENGFFSLGKEKVTEVFVYNMETSERIIPKVIDWIKGEIYIEPIYCGVEVDFNYEYANPYATMIIGEKVINGYLQLEGKTRVKDSITGRVQTALLRIPRLKLVSDLSMRLGREANPMLANFQAVGIPTGGKGDKKIMELLFLSDDIDADI